MDDILYIDQALHGYSEGHRLLASSIQSLEEETERTMMSMSDMSGPSICEGFESYITGYPLPDSKLYAIGKTWYAPEMKRPGCVWTHTLLIDYSTLAQIKDFTPIVNEFLRPSEEKLDVSLYKNKLKISKDKIANFRAYENVFSSDFIIDLISALYTYSDFPVFIISDKTSNEFDNLFLYLFSLNWPRLRRNSYFCTGSLSNRKINGKEFDLQVIPTKLLESIKSKEPSGIFIRQAYRSDHKLQPLWAKTVYENFFIKFNCFFKNFLWNFGADISDKRITFSYLSEIFFIIQEIKQKNVSLSELINKLKDFFPDKQHGKRLKASILTKNLNQEDDFLNTIKEEEILKELIVTPYYSTFDPDSLNIPERAEALWKSGSPEEQNSILSVLTIKNEELNPLTNDFLSGIAKSITPQEAIDISKDYFNVLLNIVYLRPSLAALPSMWESSPDRQYDLFRVIVDRKDYIDDNTINEIIKIIINVTYDKMAADVISAFGYKSLTPIFDFLYNREKLSIYKLSEKLKIILKSEPEMLIKLLRNYSEMLQPISYAALIAGLLDPDCKQVKDLGSKVWLNFIKSGIELLDRKSLIRFMAFILSLGFINIDSDAYLLVKNSFDTVYQAAQKEELDLESWRLLEDKLPSSYLLWWRKWNKTRRLKDALQEKKKLYNWPALNINVEGLSL